MGNVREATNELIELCEQGIIQWESLALACLRYMSESEVADLAHCEGFIEETETETNDE
jgi:hypothetical protein